MKQNEGTADRVIRLLLAVVLGYTSAVAAGPWAWIAGVLAAVMVLTAIVGFCPTYTLFGIDTRRRQTAGR